MKIAIGLFGFIRTLDVNIESFIQKLPDGDIDIYISCPDQLQEYMNVPVNEEQLRTVFRHPRIKNVYISMFSYSPGEFIDKVDACGIPQFLPQYTFFTYRVVSLINSMTKLAIFMKDSDADTFILTRMDMLSRIHRFGQCFNDIKPETAYIWRTCPLPDPGYTEDRIIISGKNMILELIGYYDNFPVVPNEFISEYTLGRYLKTKSNVVMLSQDGIFMDPPNAAPNRSSVEYINSIHQMIRDYKEGRIQK